jgi:hypothetical protein
VTATVVFQRGGLPSSSSSSSSSSPPWRSSSASLYAVPCDAASPAQTFFFNASSGWLGSPWGPGGLGCATTCGCDTYCLQMWACGVPGCGEPAYNWSLGSGGGDGGGGLLSNAQYPGLALTVMPANNSLALLPVQGGGAGSASQHWALLPVGSVWGGGAAVVVAEGRLPAVPWGCACRRRSPP